MAIPSTGQIQISNIVSELGIPLGPAFSMNSAEIGNYTPINVFSVSRPDMANSNNLSEWRGYNHSESLGCKFSATTPATLRYNQMAVYAIDTTASGYIRIRVNYVSGGTDSMGIYVKYPYAGSWASATFIGNTTVGNGVFYYNYVYNGSSNLIGVGFVSRTGTNTGVYNIFIECTVSTPAAISSSSTTVSTSSLTFSGEIRNTGGSTTTERGIVWDENPGKLDITFATGRQASGSGVGSYTVTATGLNPGSVYYFKAYGINSFGTSYGDLLHNITDLQQIVNVKNFGATGDGITDDTNFILNAISYAKTNNLKYIYFPTGDYIVIRGFNLEDNMFVYGDGPSSVLKLKSGLGPLIDLRWQAAMFMGKPSYGNGNNNDPTGAQNSSATNLGIKIKNLKIDLQRDPNNISTSTYPMAYGIRLYNASGCIIENVTISNPWNGAIQLVTTIDGVATVNNLIKGCTIELTEWYVGGNYLIPRQQPALTGIELISYSLPLTNYNNGAACYDRAGSPSPPYVCNDPAKVTRNLTDGSYIASRTYNNTITGCTLSNGSHTISLSNARNNTISNNTIVNASNRGIITSARSDNNLMTQNTISLCGSTGILLGYNSTGNTITYNTISGVRGGEGQGIGANVLASNNIIENNTIIGSPQAGIRVAHGPTGNTIRYNKITGTNPNDIEQHGIVVLANWLKYYCLDALRYGNALRADNNIVTNNIIEDVNVGVYMGDEKGFTGRLSGNVVSANTYTRVNTPTNLNVTSYRGSTTTYQGNTCAT